MPSETVELRGHLIDSLILPKVLDEIVNSRGSFKIVLIDIGQRQENPSYARIEVEGPSQDALERILFRIKQHGAEIVEEGDASLEPAPGDGVFPDGFYVTTNLPTLLRLQGQWMEIENPRMDCG